MDILDGTHSDGPVRIGLSRQELDELCEPWVQWPPTSPYHAGAKLLRLREVLAPPTPVGASGHCLACGADVAAGQQHCTPEGR